MWCLLVLLCSQGIAFSAGVTTPSTLNSDKSQYRKTRNPECFMNVSEIIRYHGYPSEEYQVTTEDGYILGVFRIPAGRNSQNTARPPSQEYGLNSVYSFDEIGKYDIPAELYFIMNKTGQKYVYCVGHSEASTAGFVAFSTYPELAQRVKVFFALGPVATITHATSPLVTFTCLPQSLIRLLLGCKGVLHQNELLKGPLIQTCGSLGKVCCSIFCYVAGSKIQNLNTSRIDTYVGHSPAGTSVQNIIHWHQITHADQFQAYDYGSKENMKKYNQSAPPAYKIEKISTPIAVWSAGHDKFADPKDVAKLLPRITNLIYHEHFPAWGHLDFIWGLDATEKMHWKIIEIITKHP
ncbi:lysosomal acid lipase/cholesteryl ester hydrolase-like [Ciconia boyciana]|uniref:lysosomal acid lipase/cholesteryl ester hydrolase-like n=1 Tax=Ciconia boyciana TaxID=52775 RepID=UPI003B9EC8DB